MGTCEITVRPTHPEGDLHTANNQCPFRYFRFIHRWGRVFWCLFFLMAPVNHIQNSRALLGWVGECLSLGIHIDFDYGSR